jgi:hypothetical protein
LGDFILYHSDIAKVLPFILRALPEFSRSSELHDLDSEARRTPGIIVAALGLYAHRLARASVRRRTLDPRLATVFDVIERLAEWPDHEVKNLVQVEFYEPVMDDDDAAWRLIQSHLGPASTALLQELRAGFAIMDSLPIPDSD